MKKFTNLTVPILRRMMLMHNMIKDKKFPNSTDFMAKTEMSIATTRRDIETLKYTLNAPLEFNREKNGYYYTEEYELPFISNTNDDWQILASAKMLLENYKGTPFYDSLSNLVLSTFSPSLAQSKYLERFCLAPKHKTIIDKEIFNLISTSLKSNKAIQFDYISGYNNKSYKHTCYPYQIVFDDGYIYLYGFSKERNDTRLFLLQRIKNLELLDETFALPDDYKFESATQGSRFGAFSSHDFDHFKIEFYNEARSYIRDSVWADDQKITENNEKNCTCLEFSSNAWYKILSWLLSQGENARPIEPEWFVDEWKNKIQKMHTLSIN